MTNEAQRIAIAEACGWVEIEKLVGSFGDRRWEFFTDDPNGYPDDSYMIGSIVGRENAEHARKSHVPDYLNDLNAMHEAENILTNEQHRRFRTNLRCITGWLNRQLVSATAAQRAEAFLRTLNLWDDSK